MDAKGGYALDLSFMGARFRLSAQLDPALPHPYLHFSEGARLPLVHCNTF
jgi:hypothetical protein